MKKEILSFAGAIVLFTAGCGGGGGSSVSYADPQIIENQTFYRVKLADLGEKYIQEFFDDNGTLFEDTYLINNELDNNRTIPYYIDDSYLYIEYDPAIKCKLLDSNLSVEFYCLKVGASGSLSLYTTRWKTLEDAMENPEN